VRRARDAFVALLVAAAVLVVPAHTAGAEVHIGTVPAGIDVLLGDYGRAWVAHDAALLDKTLAPGKLRDRVLRSVRNAASVPFRSYAVAPLTQFSGNLASARVRRQYSGMEVAAFEVTVRTAFDIEDKPALDDGAFTFERKTQDSNDRYSGWRLISDSDMDILGFFSAHFIWDDGPVTVLRSPHFLVLAHPDVAPTLESAVNVSEQSYARAAHFWPRPVKAKFAMVIPTTSGELGAIVHDTADLADFVAFVASGIDQTNGWEPGSPRVYIHLEHFRAYVAAGQIGILAHELTHAITRPVTGPHIPTWVEEGLANVAGGLPAYSARSGPKPKAFPNDDEFVTGALPDIVRHYDQAQVAIQAAVDAKGRDAVARFYEQLGSERIVPGTDQYYLAQVTKATLGWTMDQWVAAWRKALS
jgi:hypothetical protein